VPISGALVSFAISDPEPIPPHAYPETCVDPAAVAFVRTEPDGSFELSVPPGTYRLVVQKGQFRRIRDVTVPAPPGPATVPEELTTLPSRNGEGDTIPSIALVFALEAGDHIEDVLAKLDMGGLSAGNRLALGTEQFDIYNISPYEPNTALLTSLDRMMNYHIIFFPCTIASGFGDEQLNDPTGPLGMTSVRENIRSYLNAGGKIYATDMMYDVFEVALPDFVDLCGDDRTIDAADEEAWAHGETRSGWSSYGGSVDGDLSAWLDAIGVGHADLEFRENFVWIESMLDRLDPPPGESAGPKTWVQGDFALDRSRIVPLTVTFTHGAGKVLFSTYHTVGDGTSPGHDGIYPQEYVLIYLIMEIGVCQPPLL
jgi:hypothetical protein